VNDRIRSSMRGDLVVVRTETDFGECSFAMSAPLAWNRLPEKIRNLQSLQLFKSSLKTHLFRSAALPDTGKQDTDTDIVTADISRPCNGFAMLRRVINWWIYFLILFFFMAHQHKACRH